MGIGIPVFHAFTSRYQGLANKIIIPIKISKAFDPAFPPSPPFPLFEVKALWDTGSTGTGITRPTVDAVGLIPTGTVEMKHAGGCSQCNTYMVNIFLPNHVQINGVPVSEFENSEGAFGSIIGMDVLTMGDFSFTNVNKESCVSFRIPSIRTIDYAKEAKDLSFANVRRNDPCPCGKKDSQGKAIKFKKCCGKT